MNDNLVHDRDRVDANASLFNIRTHNALNEQKDVTRLLQKAQDVSTLDLTGLIAESQELERKIEALRTR